MNWRNLLSVVIFVAGSTTSFAQSNLLNAKVPSDIGKKSAAQQLKDNDKPLEYGYVDDRDILMSKKVWEIIDLDERINWPIDIQSFKAEEFAFSVTLAQSVDYRVESFKAWRLSTSATEHKDCRRNQF